MWLRLIRTMKWLGVNLSIPKYVHMALDHNLLLLDGGHAVAHVEEQKHQ